VCIRQRQPRVSPHVNGADVKLLTKNQSSAGGVPAAGVLCQVQALWVKSSRLGPSPRLFGEIYRTSSKSSLKIPSPAPKISCMSPLCRHNSIPQQSPSCVSVSGFAAVGVRNPTGDRANFQSEFACASSVAFSLGTQRSPRRGRVRFVWFLICTRP